jgi:hypothetical protein
LTECSLNRITDSQLFIAGCPAILRSDYGTENSHIASVQIALRYFHEDSLARSKSFIYGPSKFNVVGGFSLHT